MKKLKLIPGLILLALCVAVLGVGIYAAAPASNTITGTVTVTAANALVGVALYDNPTDYDPTAAFGANTTKKGENRTGGLSLSYSAINLDASSANSLEDVAPITKLIVVKNNSTTKNLGVYFQDKLGSYAIRSSYDAPEQATIQYNGSYVVTNSDILYGNTTTHYNPVNPAVASALNGKVRLDCTFYSHIAPGATVEMFVQFSLLDLDADVAATALNLYLNIEEYQPTASGTYTGFVKWNTSISSSQVPAPEANLDDDLVYPNGPGAPTSPYQNYKSGLVALVVPQGVTYLGDEGDYGFMTGCSKLVACSIPNTVEECYSGIDLYSYEGGSETGFMQGCSSLVAITIPYSLTSGLGDGATFKGCTNLGCIMVDPNNTVYSSENGCNAVIQLGYNEWVSSGKDGYYQWVDEVWLIAGCKNTVIPNDVTKIGDCAFAYRTALTSINIPSSVTEIGKYAFWGCTLTSINIPNTVTNIDDCAFYYCTSLTSINIPSSITEIGDETFYHCTALTSINIPSSVTEIGGYAFSDCTSLTSIVLPNVETISNYAFSGCTSLASVSMPSVVSLGNAAFSYCTSLTSIFIPISCTTIGGPASINGWYHGSDGPPFEECSNSLVINCEAASKPGGWNTYWAYNECTSNSSAHELSSINWGVSA